MVLWTGKSKGGKFGYSFFIFLLRHTNIRITYFFIRFVAFYFLIFSNKTAIKFYFHKIFGYGKYKTFISIYKNYCLLGQVIIDKISVLSNTKKTFTYTFEGENFLHQMVEENKGGMLIGAHMGNWEIAGHLLKRLDTKVNIVMYEAEHTKIKQILENNKIENKANIIPIKDDFSHLYKIKEAFDKNELVVMHGDRFLQGTNVITMNFLGKPAKFPTGPLYLASKNIVPVSYVFALKKTATHYHFYATKPKTYSYPAKIKNRKEELKKMLQDYINSTENILKEYPTQWFNYYPFWIEETKN